MCLSSYSIGQEGIADPDAHLGVFNLSNVPAHHEEFAAWSP